MGSSQIAEWGCPLPLAPAGARVLCHRAAWGIPPEWLSSRHSTARALPGAAHTSSHVRCRFCRADLCHCNQADSRLRDRHFVRGEHKGRGTELLLQGICSLAPFAPTARGHGKAARAVLLPSSHGAHPCRCVACLCAWVGQGALLLAVTPGAQRVVAAASSCSPP